MDRKLEYCEEFLSNKGVDTSSMHNEQIIEQATAMGAKPEQFKYFDHEINQACHLLTIYGEDPANMSDDEVMQRADQMRQYERGISYKGNSAPVIPNYARERRERQQREKAKRTSKWFNKK